MTSKGYRPAGYDSGSGSDSDLEYAPVASCSKAKTAPSEDLPQASTQSTGGPQHLQAQFKQEQYQHQTPLLGDLVFQASNTGGRGRGRGRGQINQISQEDGPKNRFSPAELLQQERDRKKAMSSKITGFQQDSGSGTPTPCVTSDYAFNASSKIRSAWGTNDVSPVHLVIANLFQTCMTDGWDVWTLGLFCTINSSDFTFAQMGYKSEAVLNGLRKFVDSQKIVSSPSKEIQEVAIEIALGQKKMTDLKIFTEVFKLSNSAQKSQFIPNVRTMCANNNFREACQCVTYLELQDQFGVHEFLVPVLLQDRYNLVEDCIQNCPELQQTLVKFLDSFFVEGHFQEYMLKDYVRIHKIECVKMDKLSSKPMSKLVKRLVARFNIVSKYYPNIGHRQRFGEVRFLFTRRYEKNEMSADSFEELVNEIAEGSSKLKEEVLSHYLLYGDLESATRFIIANGLYTSSVCLNPSILPHLPEPHKSMLENSCQQQGPVIEENWDDTDNDGIKNENGSNKTPQHVENSATELASGPSFDEEGWDVQEESPKMVESIPSRIYYRCHLSVESVQIISSPEKALQLCSWLNDIQSDGKYILSGFDSEWKPILSAKHGVALLQLAFEKKIFIMDIIALKQNPQQDNSYWKDLRKLYFENESILKLGFDVKNDVKMLSESINEWEGLSASWKSVVDLSKMKPMVLKEDPLFFNTTGTGTSSESGLSDLVYQCLGKSLSKAEQMSDWEKRPLRRQQIQYAADDAYCLIDVFKAMEEIAKSSPLDLDKIVKDYLKGLNTPGSSSKKAKLGYVDMVLELLLSQEEEDVGLAVNDQSSIKLVVDNMLQGLGRYLRVLGFDAVILNNNQPHSLCCRYAESNRMVITKGTAYNEIAGAVAEEKIYKVKSEMILDQLQELCHFFNIRLQHSRLFVICQRCSTSEFIKVSNKKMMELLHTSGISKRIKVDYCFNPSTFKGTSPDDMILCVQDSVKDWTLLDDGKLIVTNGGRVLTQRGQNVELNKLQSFAKVIDWLYICNDCGKCYWESTQVETLIKQSQSMSNKEGPLPK